MFNLTDLRQFFSLLRSTYSLHADELNRLDSEVGDGDHGYTISRAFHAAEQAVQADFNHCGELFDSASEALAASSGGAIGPLLAAFFAEGGVLFKSKDSLDVSDVERLFVGGTRAVQEIGGAEPGDKTMIDALLPATQAMSAYEGSNLDEALTHAAEAAWSGAEATREMSAAHGRGHFLGERSRGFQDAGATSMALMVEAFRDLATGSRVEPLKDKKQAANAPIPGKFINQVDDMIAEELEGIALAYPGLVKLAEPDILIRAHSKAKNKVALAIGHGGGHTPSMGGFVGPGLLDADAYGPVFTCAPGVRIARAIELGDRGAGVVLLVSNHAGDVLNARLAVRRAKAAGIEVAPVLLGDDIATAPRDHLEDRRGLGGMLFALKIGGAASEHGLNLEDVRLLMENANERTASLMVAARPPTHPASGMLMFELPQGQIEVGAGVHGEAGLYRGEHLFADVLVDMILSRLLDDLNPLIGKRVLTFLNGAGGTSMMELHILQRRIVHSIELQGLELSGSIVGSFFTTQEMGGFSLSLFALDEVSTPFWEAEARGPYFCWP